MRRTLCSVGIILIMESLAAANKRGSFEALFYVAFLDVTHCRHLGRSMC